MRRRLPLFQPGCLPQSKLTPLSIRAAARIRLLEPAAHFSRPPAKPAPADSVNSAKGYSPLFKVGRGRWGFRRLASPGTRRARLKQDLADRIRRSFPVPAQASHCLVCWLILLSSKSRRDASPRTEGFPGFFNNAPLGGDQAARRATAAAAPSCSGRSRAARRVSLTVCELRHITLPRIGLLCQRFSLTGARRQWRVLFEKRRPSQVAVGNARSRQALMKIVLVAAGPLFIALGLFWFGQAAGLASGSHNAVLIDVGAGVAALGIGLGWFALR